MNIKNSGTYSVALLMGLFLCSVEMNAIRTQLPEWTKGYVEPESDLAQYKKDILRKLGEPTIFKKDIEELQEEIRKGKESIRDRFKELGTTNDSERRDLILREINSSIEDLKPQVEQEYALKYAGVKYGISLKPEDTEKIKSAQSKLAVDREYERIVNYNRGRGTFGNSVKLEKRYIKSRPPYERHVYHELDRIKNEAQLAAKIPREVPLTWFNRFTNWLFGKPSSTLGFAPLTPQQIEKTQQASLREPRFSMQKLVPKEIQERYQILKQQQQAVRRFPPDMTPRRMYEHPIMPKPGGFIEPY
jgi:hypothetical protein